MIRILLILAFVSFAAFTVSSTAPGTEATFPGSNGKIAFWTEDSGNGEIVTMNSDGSGRTILAADPAWDILPRWSPDGQKIAFASQRGGDNYDVWVMNADGSGLVQLTDDPAHDVGPAWSPDGTQIAFASARSGEGDVYVMNADGANVRRVTNLPGYDDGVDWSPDGSYIAFENSDVGLSIMHPDGSGFVNLVYEFVSGVSWSPDGSRIAFASRQDGDFEIHTISMDGTERVQVTSNDGVEDSAPAWSPDGTKIAFYSGRQGGGIFLMNTDGTGVTKIPNTGPNDFFMSWQQLLPHGDADCDGDVDSIDALWVLKDTVGLPHSAACIAEGDVDCDGDVDSVDALRILRHVAGLPVNLPPGCPKIGP